MLPRERVLTTLRRKTPDRVPKSMSLCPSQLERFRKETGANDPADYYNFEVRTIQPLAYKNPANFEPYLAELPEGARVDEWGIAWIRGDFHFERMVHPLRHARHTREVLQYPFPNLVAEERFQGYAARIAETQQKGFAVEADCMAVGGTVFWPAYKLRGMEALLIDLIDNQDFAATLLDTVTDMMVGLAKRLAQYNIDILFLADDFGTQRALMMRPRLWRQWFKPRLAAVIAAARSVRPDILVRFHSDGKIDDIISDLIEIGVDVLNPVQPEVMDPAVIKATYGHDLAFWGAVGTQTTMPFGSPEEVRRIVRNLIETVGAGGGLLIAPTHVVEPEVPWENVQAFIDAVDEYGCYS